MGSARQAKGEPGGGDPRRKPPGVSSSFHIWAFFFVPQRLPHLGFSRDGSFVLQQSEEENADEEFDFRPAGGEEDQSEQFMSR